MVSGKRVLIFPDRMDRGKWIIQFPGHRNPIKIGQAHICELNPGHWLLQAIDIEEPYWRQGYGTLLMARIREHLLARKATSLHSSNTGSGTVQILSRVFCAEDVRHFAHGEEITYQEAVRIMDVEFGYTRTVVSFKAPPHEDQSTL